MKWLRVALWVALVVVELAIAVQSGSVSVAGYVAAGVTGGLGVLIYLRRRAASGSSRLAAEIESGRVVWAAQVRRGDFGGTLRLYPGHEFRYDPDEWSGRHEAMPQSWAVGTRLTFTDTRRDITGLTIQGIVLTPPHGSPTAFQAYGVVGTLPDACVI